MASVTKVELGHDGLAAESGVITVYNYDPDTGLFTGESDEFLAQGVGIPANSTTDVPPKVMTDKVSVYKNGGWQQLADHRGEIVYDIVTKGRLEISLPGNYPEGKTVLEPATEFDIWNGEAWVTDLLAQQAAVVRAAEHEKNLRIAEANSISQAWQTQLMLGIIRPEDKNKLSSWMEYIQKVQDVNSMELEFIDWPEKPY